METTVNERFVVMGNADDGQGFVLSDMDQCTFLRNFKGTEYLRFATWRQADAVATVLNQENGV